MHHQDTSGKIVSGKVVKLDAQLAIQLAIELQLDFKIEVYNLLSLPKL